MASQDQTAGTKKQSPGTLIYIHIPKCAGSTMMGVLRQNYGPGFFRIKPGGQWRDIKIPRGATCVAGHIPYGIGNQIQGPVKYAVMLRRPLDRVASLYRFCREFSGHRWHKKAISMCLADFVNKCLMSDLDNGMVRWLAGRSDVGTLKIQEMVGPEDLARAVRHLGAMHIGFVEEFQLSLKRFGKLFNWQDLGYTVRQRSKRKRDLTEADIKAVKTLNQYDIALYNWARNRVV